MIEDIIDAMHAIRRNSFRERAAIILQQMGEQERQIIEERKEYENNRNDPAYWNDQYKKWRKRRIEEVEKACADQPAGCPVIYEDLNFPEPLLAANYLEPNRRRPKRKHLTAAELEQMQKDRIRRHEEAIIKYEESMTLEEYELYLIRLKNAKNQWLDDFDGKTWRERRIWYSERIGAWVTILENRETGKCKLEIRCRRYDEGDSKANLYFSTWNIAKVYKLESELRAMELLRSKITEEQYAKYVCTGMLIEQSKKTGLFYIFRRCRPALVFRQKTNRGAQYVCGLCVHPQGYYVGTWAGTMVPTDDIVAQLLFMRADEAGLWRRSIHHGRRDPCVDF